jgi:uncharacterized membrane protein YsdA (DUF1294 family)
MSVAAVGGRSDVIAAKLVFYFKIHKPAFSLTISCVRFCGSGVSRMAAMEL